MAVNKLERDINCNGTRYTQIDTRFLSEANSLRCDISKIENHME